MSTKSKIAIAILAVVVSFGFGRFTGPTKTITEVKTVEVEKKVDETTTESQRRTHVEKTKTEVTRPDGTKESTEKTTTDTGTDTERSSKDTTDTSKSSDATKEITRGGSTLTLSGLVGIDLHNPSGFDYG